MGFPIAELTLCDVLHFTTAIHRTMTITSSSRRKTTPPTPAPAATIAEALAGVEAVCSVSSAVGLMVRMETGVVMVSDTSGVVTLLVTGLGVRPLFVVSVGLVALVSEVGLIVRLETGVGMVTCVVWGITSTESTGKDFSKDLKLLRLADHDSWMPIKATPKFVVKSTDSSLANTTLRADKLSGG